jgi:hypothetical protein
MSRIPNLGLLALTFSSGCATRQAELEFAGQWRVVELRIDDETIPFPATAVKDGCTNGYEIRVDSDGASGEVHYDYSYDCGDEPVYYSLALPVTLVRDAGSITVVGQDLGWTCSSGGTSAWECSRGDGAVLVLRPA